jgi:uncharacterized lipoprotein YmbA
MMMKRRLLALVLLSGCSFFSRSKSQFYSIEPIAATGAVASVRGNRIAIDSIELPPGLDRRELVVRKADRQLDVRATEQWSAILSRCVLHTMAFDLARRLPEGMVILPGEAKPNAPMRSIDLAFEELAAGPDAKLVLDARWVVHETGHADTAGHERIEIDLKSLDGAGVADGVSRSLAALADRIVVQLARV